MSTQHPAVVGQSTRLRPPPLMTPEQRRRLIEAPLSIQTHGGRTWAGTVAVDIETGVRLHTLRPNIWDEEATNNRRDV